MSNATHNRVAVPLRLLPVDWKIVEQDGTAHTFTSLSAIQAWFVSHHEVDYDTLTLIRNGRVIKKHLPRRQPSGRLVLPTRTTASVPERNPQ